MRIWIGSMLGRLCFRWDIKGEAECGVYDGIEEFCNNYTLHRCNSVLIGCDGDVLYSSRGVYIFPV
jgi:hypothetical protein